MPIKRGHIIYYPEITVDQMLRDAAKLYPNRPAFLHPREMTFKEWDISVDKFAAALAGLGVEKGDRVALYAPNSIEFETAFFGVLRSGATAVPLNPMFRVMELEYHITDSEVVGVLCHDELYPLLKKAIEENKISLKFIIIIGDKKPDTYSFDELLEEYEPSPLEVEITVKEDLACIQYTAGTTGPPKGCMITHFNIVSNVYQMSSSLPVGYEEDATLTVLPLCHIYGLTCIMCLCAKLGMPQVVMPRFEIEQFCELIEKYPIAAIAMVTPMFLFLAMHLENPETKKYDWSYLRMVNNGAAPISEALIERFRKIVTEKCNCSNLIITQGFGLSEASPVVAANPIEAHPAFPIKIKSVGILMPDTEHKILDPDTGKDLPVGEVGELLIKGPQVMKGYWKKSSDEGFWFDPETNEKWLRTGDLAYIDEQGYEHLIDRVKEIIKYRGYSIAPFELENLLVSHPAITDSAVIGKPDPVSGEIPKAFIVLKPEYYGKVKKDEIIEWVRDRIAAYKRIREVEFVNALPRSIAGKLLRRTLKEKEIEKTKELAS